MAVIGTFNGASVLALPSTPAPKQIQLSMNNMVAAPVSPFTGSNLQVQKWPGGDFWTAEIAMPKLRPGAEVAVWLAFLAECQGKLNTFAIADSGYKGARGSLAGTPLVNGAQTPMANTLATKGWTANAAGVLLAGDYIQLGVVSSASGTTTGPRLHRVTVDADADADGNATLSFWPSIRDPLTDGQAIITVNPIGLFRMAENMQSMTTDETLLGATSFKLREAR